MILGSHLSGTHARTQGLVKGKLVVPDDLPKHLKQSLFEHGGEYQVVARYSSEPGDPGLDVGWPSLVGVNLAESAFVGPHSTASRLRHESLQCTRRNA